MKRLKIIVFVLLLTITLMSCDTKHADLVCKLTNNNSKEWIVTKNDPTTVVTNIIFYKNGEYDNGFSKQNEWEFLDDGTKFKTRIDNDLVGFQEHTSEIIELSENKFVIMRIENGDTLITTLKTKRP